MTIIQIVPPLRYIVAFFLGSPDHVKQHVVQSGDIGTSHSWHASQSPLAALFFLGLEASEVVKVYLRQVVQDSMLCQETTKGSEN